MKPRLLTAVGVGLGLTAAGASVAVAGLPTLAGAAAPAASPTTDDDATTTTTTTTTDDPESSEGPSTTGDPDEPAARAGDAIREALQPLVDAGTITADQADQVVDALRDARPFGRHGPGGGVHVGIGLDAAATALGVSPEDLRAALADGQSIADVAADQGVEVQTVIDALVAEATTRLDAAVADGRLTEEEAATRLEEITERITGLVDQAGGLRGPGRPGFPGRADGSPWPGGPAAPDAPAPSDAAPTTTGD